MNDRPLSVSLIKMRCQVDSANNHVGWRLGLYDIRGIEQALYIEGVNVRAKSMPCRQIYEQAQTEDQPQPERTCHE